MPDPGLDEQAIIEIVRGLDPVDWVQMRLTARLSPADRVRAGMKAQAFAMAIFRGTLQKRYPELSLWQLNMKVLAHFTSIRMPKSDPRRPDNY